MEFLKTQGTRIVNESGQEVLLKGYGIGNWMNLEGFLFGTSTFGADLNGFARAEKMDRGRSINQSIIELCGRTYADKFWNSWYRNYFGQADIIDLAQRGFNSVRLPLNARVFLLEEPGIQYDEDMLAYLDQIIDWCEENGLYVILDLHAAAAAQSTIPCDDGYDNMPHLFTDEDGFERTILLWEKFAQRYKDRAVVAGYELLNEPLSLPKWNCLLPKLMEFYRECIARIRKIDTRHILFLEGYRFASRCDIFTKDMDPGFNNWAVAMHLYESVPDLGTVGPIFAAAEELGVPLWLGETGGNKEYMTTAYEMFYENHAGVNIWCHKGVEGADAATLCSFRQAKDMDIIRAYAHQGGPKPTYERAIAIFDELLENVKFENCILHPDRVDAILRRPFVEIPAVGYDMFPGAGQSFRGNYRYCAFCGYRREDPMHIVYEKGFTPYESPAFAWCAIERAPKYGDWMHLELLLHQDDFACYTIREVQKDSRLSLICRSQAGSELEVTIRGNVYKVAIPASEDLITVEVGLVPAGEDTSIKIAASRGQTTLRTVKFA